MSFQSIEYQPDGMDSSDVEWVEEEDPPLPEWSNSFEAVPKQEGKSCAARAAFELRNQLQDVPMPLGFEYKRRSRSHPQVRRAHDLQTALVLDAYLALSCVTTIGRATDMQKLKEAEGAELRAYAGAGSHDPLAAPPRGFALTLIVRQSAMCPSRYALLDAAAFWAHYGGEECAARVCRITVLADAQAREYTSAVGRGNTGSNEQLLLVARNADGDTTHVHAEVQSRDTAKQYLDQLVRLAAGLFDNLEKEPPAAVVRCFDDVEEEHVHGAYVASIKEKTDDFWDRVYYCAPFAPIETPLDFEQHRTFVRLVPIPRDNQPPPMRDQFTFGILTYAAGMHEAARDYCVAATREEKQKHPHRPPHVPYGLRFPLNSAEHSIRLHVLECSYGLASFARELSCFALLTAPGKPVCIQPNASVPRLCFHIVPFDEAFCHDKFVLPVTQKQVDSGNLHEHNPQWEAFDHAITVYRKAWGQQADEETPPSSRFRLASSYRPPSQEETLAASLFGVARCGASSLSEVYADFQKLKCEVPHVTRFLTTAIAKHGPGASLPQTLSAMAAAAAARKAEERAIADKERRLEQEAERLRLLAAKKPTIPSVPKELVPAILAALGRKPKRAA